MKCRDRVIVGLMAAWVLLICGCGGKRVNSPEDSVLKNNVYTNKFFSFGVQIPDTWTVLKKPTVREMRNAAEALNSGNKQAASATLQSMARVHSLLLARNVVVGMSITVTAESVAHTPEIQTGQEYLEHALDLFTGSDKPLQRVGPITAVQLFGREFYRVDLTGNLMGARQHQAMFARIEKGHALIFALTAKSPPAVEEAIAMVGMDGSVPPLAAAPKT
ncbi:MAG TPA: hypothetical protein VJ063_08410, partial [Verrucomicrobiae bacterium]|nr:hypothetical protein [Verrucomicrobiae bacterium]